MIATSFYTFGTLYEREVRRLSDSLNRVGIAHHVAAIADLGSWVANTHYTPTHLLRVMAQYPNDPLLYLDADAYVWRYPELLDSLDADIAVHYRRGRELLNGTLYIAPTDAARKCIQRYATLVEANPDSRDEQAFLAQAIAETQPRVFRLPPSYCWIHDVMMEELANEGFAPVIEHLQASREVTGSQLLGNRRRRLEQIGG